MAQLLTEWPATRPRSEDYNWDEWFDGQIRVLTKDEDFVTEPSSFRSSAYQAAKRRTDKYGNGIKVRLHSYPDGRRVAIQSYRV